MSAIVFVTYAGDGQTRFDRDYYVDVHLPLVMRCWAQYGLESVAAFFPAGDGGGTIAVTECRFRDEASIGRSFGSAEAGEAMADIARFTDVVPVQFRAMRL